jgi:predicted glycogen debranching enzyme
MSEVVRRLEWTGATADPESLLSREWLVTNGLGGYASGTLAGVATRRYHGVLVSALPTPLGRRLMLSHLSEELRLPDGRCVSLGGEERIGRVLELPGAVHLREFRLEMGLPVWTYAVDGWTLEKRVLMPHMQNATQVCYRLLGGGGSLRLRLRPSVHFRSYEEPVSTVLGGPYRLVAYDDRFEVTDSSQPELPALRLFLHGRRTSFTVAGQKRAELLFRHEEERGYQSSGEMWSPGFFRADLAAGADVTLVASTESWETIQALSPEEARAAETERLGRLLDRAPPHARSGPAGELVLASDQFIITPLGRVEDAARARAAGEEVRTVIAGYHWFTDWGRDTMISLEGLALCTGRGREAGYILRTFAHYVRDGLIPNMFPDGSNEGLYHTADATLWYFHALDRYLRATGDQRTLEVMLPTMRDIVAHHLRGTRFGIGVDPADGLLRQGAEGYQLTWMDAKVDGWVVTPRRGKAVEINALWYNALRVLEGWEEEMGDTARAAQVRAHGDRAFESFNRRFWYPEGGYLYDVVDGEDGHDDPACRPNQVFAISLPNPVLDRARWGAVMEVVHDRLLTPVGLRSLAPGHPDYRPTYEGDLRARDAAYHQGTVWAWLIGPYVDAWLKVHPGERAQARRCLEGLVRHLNDFGMGTIAEVFDAEPPFTPRGCIAQAWSVAETLRSWIRTEPARSIAPPGE